MFIIDIREQKLFELFEKKYLELKKIFKFKNDKKDNNGKNIHNKPTS